MQKALVDQWDRFSTLFQIIHVVKVWSLKSLLCQARVYQTLCLPVDILHNSFSATTGKILKILWIFYRYCQRVENI